MSLRTPNNSNFSPVWSLKRRSHFLVSADRRPTFFVASADRPAERRASRLRCRIDHGKPLHDRRRAQVERGLAPPRAHGRPQWQLKQTRGHSHARAFAPMVKIPCEWHAHDVCACHCQVGGRREAATREPERNPFDSAHGERERAKCPFYRT